MIMISLCRSRGSVCVLVVPSEGSESQHVSIRVNLSWKQL